MENEAALTRLEKYIEDLLGTCRELTDEKKALIAKLGEKEQEIRDFQAKVAALRDERATVHGRVSSLIERMAAWENDRAADAPSPDGSDEESGPVLAAVQSEPPRLFSFSGDK